LENLKIICVSGGIILQVERNYHEKCDDLDKGRTVMDFIHSLIKKIVYHVVTIWTSISQVNLVNPLALEFYI
jgi:hypothetical protein